MTKMFFFFEYEYILFFRKKKIECKNVFCNISANISMGAH